MLLGGPSNFIVFLFFFLLKSYWSDTLLIIVDLPKAAVLISNNLGTNGKHIEVKSTIKPNLSEMHIRIAHRDKINRTTVMKYDIKCATHTSHL